MNIQANTHGNRPAQSNDNANSPYVAPGQPNLMQPGWSAGVWGGVAVLAGVASLFSLRFVETNARVLPNGTRMVDASLEVALLCLLLGLVAFGSFVMAHRRGRSPWKRWQSAALLLLALFAAVPGVLAACWYVFPFVGFFL